MTDQGPSGPADDDAQNNVWPDGHYQWDGNNWQPKLDSYGAPATSRRGPRRGIATVWVLLSIFFCFPVGFVLVFLSHWTQKTKFAVSGAMAAVLLLFAAIGASAPHGNGTANVSARTSAESQSRSSASDNAAAQAASRAAAAKAAAYKAAADKAAADKAAADKAAADKAAVDQAAAQAAAAAAPQPAAQTHPYAAATAARAPAACADGTRSSSATPSGTCSYHGGVPLCTGNV